MGRLGWHEVKDIRLRFWKVALLRSARLAQSEFPAGHRALCFIYTAYNSRTKPRGLIASFRQKQPQYLDLFFESTTLRVRALLPCKLLTIKDLLLVERETCGV